MTTPATPDPLAACVEAAWAAASARSQPEISESARIASDIARAQRTEAQIRKIVRDEIKQGRCEVSGVKHTVTIELTEMQLHRLVGALVTERRSLVDLRDRLLKHAANPVLQTAKWTATAADQDRRLAELDSIIPALPEWVAEHWAGMA